MLKLQFINSKLSSTKKNLLKICWISHQKHVKTAHNRYFMHHRVRYFSQILGINCRHDEWEEENNYKSVNANDSLQWQLQKSFSLSHKTSLLNAKYFWKMSTQNLRIILLHNQKLYFEYKLTPWSIHNKSWCSSCWHLSVFNMVLLG